MQSTLRKLGLLWRRSPLEMSLEAREKLWRTSRNVNKFDVPCQLGLGCVGLGGLVVCLGEIPRISDSSELQHVWFVDYAEVVPLLGFRAFLEKPEGPRTLCHDQGIHGGVAAFRCSSLTHGARQGAGCLDLHSNQFDGMEWNHELGKQYGHFVAL